MNIQKIDAKEYLYKDIYKEISSLGEPEKNENKSNQKNKDNNLPDKKEIEKIENKLNNVAASLNFQIEFKQHKGTKKFYVEIVDKNTKKIIREIPPEQILDFLSKFEKMLGILFDRRT